MVTKGFLNIVLILSFLLSSLGGEISTYNNMNGPSISPISLELLLGKLKHWVERLNQNNSVQSNLLINSITPTYTPTHAFGIVPTIGLTLIPDPTGKPTITPTISPTTSPTVFPTETITPTLTPTFQPTETITPTITPTAQPTGTITSTLPVSLTLSSYSETIMPGDQISVTWKVDGWNIKDAAELVLIVPVGFAPQPTLVNSYAWDAAHLSVKIPLKVLQGEIGLNISEDARGPFKLKGELIANNKIIATTALEFAEDGLTIIGQKGGIARGFGGTVKVEFPPNAAPGVTDEHPMSVRIRRPTSKSDTPYYLSDMPFVVLAEQESNQIDGMIRQINEFSQTITITVTYTDTQVHGDESMLTIFYFDETAETWMPLDTQVDMVDNLLIAQLNHLTQFDFNAQDWEAARLPSLKDFQVSQFTGAATYGFSFQVPPGPGGLQPSLSLSYNSQIVDSASSKTQSAWVGMGWSLDTGSIQRNQNGTPNYYGDDTFSLQVNGVGGTLLPITDQDSDPNTIDYRLENDNFWRVRQYTSSGNVGGYSGDTSYWVVWDKEGTQYYFGNYASPCPGGDCYAGHAWYPAYPNGCGSIYMQTWEWALTRVRNVFGQELTYIPYREISPVGKYGKDGSGNPCSGYPASMAIAVYPDTIIYSNNRYRIRFIHDATRTDYDTAWDAASYTMLYQRSKLLRIEIWQDPDGIWSSGGEQLIRKYVLNYGENNQQIFPGVSWSGGGHTLTLTSITEYGLNGASSLPSTTFVYDHMHLTQADNGYGGRITYQYEASAWHEIDSEADSITSGLEGNWIYPYNNGWCNNYTGYDVPVYPASEVLHPGQVYKFAIRLHSCVDNYNLPNTTHFGLWLSSDGTNRLIAEEDKSVTYENSNTGTVTAYLRVPDNISYGRFIIAVDGNAVLYKYVVWPMVTRYRVISRTETDLVTNVSHTFTYHYDEAATNDAEHSAFVVGSVKDTRYNPAFGEYRGNAMVQEIAPDGKVTTSFFYQDDNSNGNPATTLVGTQDYSQPFNTPNWSDYNTDWAYNGTQPTFERLTGDIAAKISTGSDTYRSVYTLANGKMALAQFRVSGTSPEAILAITSGTFGSSYYRWGIRYSGSTLYVHKCVSNDSNCTNTTLISGITADTWYVVLFIVDNTNDDHFLMRVWKRDNPSQVGRWEEDLTAYSGRSWRFIAKAPSGMLYVDEYSEGKLYSLNDTLYDHQTTFTVSPMPCKDTDNDYLCETSYQDLGITWSYVTQSKNMNFNGGSQWQGTLEDYSYLTSDQGGNQYGNLTQLVNSYWNAGAWVAYKASRSKYFPNVTNGTPETSRYLTGLKAYDNSYSCQGGCDWSVGDLLSAHIYLYDTNPDYNYPPTNGIPKGESVFTHWVSSTPYYADTAYTYDSWGNKKIITQYTGYGASFGSGGGAETSYFCYGSGETLGGQTCSNDNYHSYLNWDLNAMGQWNHYYYDLTKGVLTSIDNPNHSPTNDTTVSASYDDFGRISTIIRPGDDSTNPTMRFSYHPASGSFTNNPFWTEAQQRITGSTYFKIRKYYNGLGQLIQTQVVGATIGAQTRDIIVDTAYDAGGRVHTQTVPYDITTGGNYHIETQQDAIYYTTTSYDSLGRPLTSLATDGSQTSYQYWTAVDGSGTGFQYIMVINPRSYSTTTKLDSWGRTVKIDAPTGPDVDYTYDEADRLTSTTRGGALTTFGYDFGGRKISMSDPDMGPWSYAYDAVGNMTRQADAKGQRVCMYYDNLNRLIGKQYYDTDSCPAFNPAAMNARYWYDNYADNTIFSGYTGSTINGIGRRTGMIDSSGRTISTFDTHGREIQESKIITGSGTFKTQWTYNSADLVKTMIYPSNASSGSGETVTYTYLPQMVIDSVNGSIGPTTYVQHTDYDAAGRVDLRKLGADLLRTDYVYFPWNTEGGRLEYLKTGTPINLTSMQNFTYTYDENGNDTVILDAKNSNQKQCFLYDSLDRLTRGTTQLTDQFCQATQIGNGQFDESYVYNSTSGNLSSKGGYTLTYGDTNHKHAATAWNGWTYTYDANGNMATRAYGGTTYTLTYDQENHLTGMTGGGVSAGFTYDGDGNRVKGTIANVTTTYIGNYFEWTGNTTSMKSYYYEGTTRVAMRTGTANPLWLLGDHLGSTSKVANYDGLSENSQQLYKPWGEKRWSSGTLPTTFQYTGQRHEKDMGLSGGEGLMFYGARWYDQSLGRWVQPDTVIPQQSQGMQAWDRYAYTNNNPVKYTDPSGHFAWLPVLTLGGALIGAVVNYTSQVVNNYQNNGGDLGAALTSNIDIGSIANSALTGAAVGFSAGVLGPAALAATGYALTGIGLLYNSTAIFSTGLASFDAAASLGSKIYGVPINTNSNPLSGITYSEKVKEQATWNDYHGFPEHVDAFGADGTLYTQLGNHDVLYTHVEIEGGYKNAEGIFHYVINPDGVCNHRLFEPK